MEQAIEKIQDTIPMDEFEIVTKETIQKVMNITFDILDDEYGKCTYCTNLKCHFALFSLCKMNPHLDPHCIYYNMDIRKFIKKNFSRFFLEIYIRNKTNKVFKKELKYYLSRKNRDKIIYQSAQIYDMMQKENKFFKKEMIT